MKYQTPDWKLYTSISKSTGRASQAWIDSKLTCSNIFRLFNAFPTFLEASKHEPHSISINMHYKRSYTLQIKKIPRMCANVVHVLRTMFHLHPWAGDRTGHQHEVLKRAVSQNRTRFSCSFLSPAMEIKNWKWFDAVKEKYERGKAQEHHTECRSFLGRNAVKVLNEGVCYL